MSGTVYAAVARLDGIAGVGARVGRAVAVVRRVAVVAGVIRLVF